MALSTETAPPLVVNPGLALVSDPTPMLPTDEDGELDELDIVDSDFSWSSVASPAPQPDTAPPPEPAQSPLDIAHGGAQENLTVSTGVQTEEARQKEPIQKHSAYFWECITFQVSN